MEISSTLSFNSETKYLDEASTIAMQNRSAVTVECDSCGSKDAVAKGAWEEFEYNDGRKSTALRAYVDVVACPTCGMQYTTSDAEDRRHEALCKHLGRMTPNEIRAIRTAFNITQAELAQRLDGVSLASIKRWEGGNCIQSAAFDVRLRSLQQDLATQQGATRFSPRFVTDLPESILESESLFELRPARRQA